MHVCAYSLPLDGAPSHDQITPIKKFYGGLSGTVKSLPKHLPDFEAIFFSSKRSDSLEKFLGKVKGMGL
uniref:Uncharacterized protein n=1 Tax=Nelumbo nucifera TaxID=4432 RepID=A0A822Y0U4_NELNU|nr:TPA_asm: hypothetical protein HUJ06_026159 [Nelumbo nucifera]